jgi:PTH2 family peptidyl-tRNA hydrolase
MTIKQILVLRKDLGMRKGKMIAQAAHASMKFIIERLDQIDESNYHFSSSKEEREWMSDKFTKICVSVDSEQELLDLIEKGKASDITVHSIIDSGKTEFHGVPTLTCAAFGPAPEEKLKPITGHLKLL